MTAGVPAPLTPAIEQAVIDRILDRKSLKVIAKEIGYAESTIQKWMMKSPLFAGAVRSARAEAAHGLMDETIEIADDVAVDPQQARNMIQARWRLAETRNPKDYSQKTELTVNQVTDLRGTMIEARKRVVLPVCDLEQIAPVQDAEYAQIPDDKATDKESAGLKPPVNPFD
jgi:hypothetical protein